MVPEIFHRDFTRTPYWWEAYTPTAGELFDVPHSARVAIVGGGYAGLSTALELAKHGLEAVVLEADEPGFGASTRNGGAVSGGVNIGKSFTGRTADVDPERAERLLSDASDAFTLIDRLVAEEQIDCFWEKPGRFVGAWTKKHFGAQTRRLAILNSAAQSGAYMVPRERQREEIASDYYFGGMVVERSGKLHPALYYKGLLAACRRHGVLVCAKAPVTAIRRIGAGWRVETGRGAVLAGDVVIATNGYTGNLTPALRHRVVPVASHIIASEELPQDLARSLVPKARTLSDTKRVLCYYRMSPDGRRMVFGGRARFTQVDPTVSAPILYRYMTDRFPQLRGFKVTHAWTGNVAFTFDALPHMGQSEGLHYCLGCNGSGVAMMTYLGWQTARKIARAANYACSFDTEEFPDHPLYSGNPWFLPVVGGYYRLRDNLDRMLRDTIRSERRLAMDFETYKSSLAQETPPQGLSDAAQALWWEAKGDWHQAHQCAQNQPDAQGAWAHAYLHRVEGDLSNAGGWYRRAGRPMPTTTAPLKEEWETIARALLA